MRDSAKSGPVDLLKIFSAGSISVGVNGRPLLTVDAESRSIGIEVEGIEESGVKLSNFGTPNHRVSFTSLVRTSLTTAKDLAELGWRFSLNERGSTILMMGRGVSRLTGHVRGNPLKLRRLARIL